MAKTAFAGVGLPKPYLCKNTSTGAFLYSMQTRIQDGLAHETIRHPATVKVLADITGVTVGHADVIFGTAEFISTPENCESNARNPFANRCHPELSITFVSESGAIRVPVAVGFLSLRSTRHVHETSFTTWDEYEISVGIVPVGGAYSHHDFIIDHPQCALNN